MANQSNDPPSGKPPVASTDMAGASTVMLEAPVIPGVNAPAAAPASAARPIADQKTAILEAGSAEMASVQAQIAEARAKAGGAPPPSSAPPPSTQPIADQKTAILDSNSPQMAAVQAQVAEARAKAAAQIAPTAPIADQKTAILDSNSPQMAAVQRQVAEARARSSGGPPPSAPPPAGAPMADQKTAILDSSSPQMAAVHQQISAARAAASAGPPMGAGGAGGAQRTMALDVSAQQAQQARYGGAPAAQQQLRPLAPVKPPSTAMRWVLGPVIALVTCGVTYAAAGAVLSRGRVEDGFADKPKVIVMGKIKLNTTPPGASVTLDGKPIQHFTPTEIEGAVSETPAHLVVKVEGFETVEQDVLFAKGVPQELTLVLPRKDDTRKPKPRTGPATPADTKPADVMVPVGDKGMIGVIVTPEANVTLDGQAIGKTPIGSLTLKPGMHVFELSNEKLGKREKLRIDVKIGENAPIVRNWQRR